MRSQYSSALKITTLLLLLLACGSCVLRAESTSEPAFIGEKLIYQMEWDPPWYLFFLPNMEAGEIEVQTEGEVEFRNEKALIYQMAKKRILLYCFLTVAAAAIRPAVSFAYRPFISTDASVAEPNRLQMELGGFSVYTR